MSAQPEIDTTSAPVRYLEAKRQQGRDRRRRRSVEWQAELERRLADGERCQVDDDHLGHPYPEPLRRHYDTMLVRVHDDIERGATVHRRVPWLVRQIPWAVTLLDGLILYNFCAVIFDVPPHPPHPFLTTERLMAIGLAVLGSAITYTWLSLTGTRLRGCRTPLGELDRSIMGRTTRTMTGVSGVVTAALAVLMYLRVTGEADSASLAGYLSNSATALMGLVFAVLSSAANVGVIAVHALDGSADADELRHSGRLLRRSEQRRERERRRAWRRGKKGMIAVNRPQPDTVPVSGGDVK
jgi:hypothetical protein